jgi:hypothetical protein
MESLHNQRGRKSLLTLPKQVKQRLASEFRFAAEKMAEAEDLDTKLYYFSVFSGETTRMLNLSWHRELALLHSVTQDTHRSIQARINEVRGGIDPGVIGIPGNLAVTLTKIGRALANLFEENEIDTGELFNILAKAAELSYATTGNGKYLMVKGQIKF